jgi:sigma-B regulation protein RsbU (phosphoserine phosphatase)
MEDHNNMFFTIWYGVFDKETRQILYASGGHPPAILMTGTSAETAQLYELKTPGIVIGAVPEEEFVNATCQVQAFNRLFVFSDGVYEILKCDGSMMNLHEFRDLFLKMPWKKESELTNIVRYIQNIQGRTDFIDDFSLLQITFKS